MIYLQLEKVNVLVYLSNENSEAVNVHFDDLTVYHGKTNIVQANDYYPFGLSSSTYSRTASLFNYYLFNQSSRLEEETEWYHTPFRKYDASIGRFTGVDALASSMASINSYHYAYNNPVNFSDASGLSPRPTRHENSEMQNERAMGGGNGGMMGAIMRALGRMFGSIGTGMGGSDNWDGGGGGTPLSGNHWTNYVADLRGDYNYNANFMSIRGFRDRYDVDNMTNEEKANFAAGMAQESYSGSFGVMNFSSDGDKLLSHHRSFRKNIIYMINGIFAGIGSPRNGIYLGRGPGMNGTWFWVGQSNGGNGNDISIHDVLQNDYLGFGLGFSAEALDDLEKLFGTKKEWQTRYSNILGKLDIATTIASVVSLSIQMQTREIEITPQRYLYTLNQKALSLIPGWGGVAVDGLDILLNNLGMLDHLDEYWKPIINENENPMKIHKVSRGSGRMY